MCGIVGIIDRGRLIAEGTRRELVSKLGEQDRIDITAADDPEKLAEASRAVPGVTSAVVADHAVHLFQVPGRRPFNQGNCSIRTAGSTASGRAGCAACAAAT